MCQKYDSNVLDSLRVKFWSITSTVFRPLGVSHRGWSSYHQEFHCITRFASLSHSVKPQGNQTRRFPDLEPDTQVPFSSPLPIPDDAATSGAAGQSSSVPSASTAEPSTSDSDMEHQVVSRLHLTEEKIANQKSFEEKERAEAHRKAKLEKIQAKRVCCLMVLLYLSVLSFLLLLL